MPYHLTYHIEAHPDGLSKDEVLKVIVGGEDGGACDAALLVSIVLPEEGGMSTVFLGMDGRTGEDLSIDLRFKLWVLMAARLAEDPDAPEGVRQLASGVFNHIKTNVAAGRGMADNTTEPGGS